MSKKITVHSTAAVLTAVFMLCGCSSSTEIEIKPEDEVITEALVTEAETETVTEAITEPAVTEPEGVKRLDPETVRIRPSKVNNDYYSGLSDYEVCYTVTDGYYQINFLEDKLFEEEINSDIKAAMDSLLVHREDFARESSRAHSSEINSAGGILADIICRNGYLSILLEYGYYEPLSVTHAGAYSVLLKDKDVIYADYAVTLNYELTTKNRINDFSELFYSDTDWNAVTYSAVFKEYNGFVSYYPDGAPELFTIDYILVKTGNEDYAVERYNDESLNLSYCDSMISSNYRLMSGVSEYISDSLYEMYTQTGIETCPGCGFDYTYKKFHTSRFYSDEEISLMNEELEKLYEHGFPGKENHECWSLRSTYGTVTQYNPDTNRRTAHLDLWSCTDKNGNLYFYDRNSYEQISPEYILGSDWRSYAKSENEETPDISAFTPSSVSVLAYNPENHTVHAVLRGFSDTYQTDITVIADVPDDCANQNYLYS